MKQSITGVQNIFRPVKKIAVKLNLIPKSMVAKKILKRFIFGKLVKMPAEITHETSEYIVPNEISGQIPDTKHKVILCAVFLPEWTKFVLPRPWPQRPKVLRLLAL